MILSYSPGRENMIARILAGKLQDDFVSLDSRIARMDESALFSASPFVFVTENRNDSFTCVVDHLMQTQTTGSKILYCFFPVQDERNFMGKAVAQILSQEKDLVLFGYDYWDYDAEYRILRVSESELNEIASNVRNCFPLRDRDRFVFPCRPRQSLSPLKKDLMFC